MTRDGMELIFDDPVGMSMNSRAMGWPRFKDVLEQFGLTMRSRVLNVGPYMVNHEVRGTVVPVTEHNFGDTIRWFREPRELPQWMKVDHGAFSWRPMSKEFYIVYKVNARV